MHRCNIGDTLIQGERGYISGRPHNFLAASTPLFIPLIPCLPHLLTLGRVHAFRIPRVRFQEIWKFIFGPVFEKSIEIYNFAVVLSFRVIFSLSPLFPCYSLSLFSLFTFKHWLLPRGIYHSRDSAVSTVYFYRCIYFYRESYGQFPFRINSQTKPCNRFV